MNKTAFEKLMKTPIQNETDYFRYVRAAYEEWVFGARKNNPPQFFAGSIDSKLAVISLNPHAGTPNREIAYDEYCRTWEEYCHFFTHFPHERYAPDGGAFHAIPGVSKFDKELHCFFSGNPNARHADLAKWQIFHVEISHEATSGYQRPQEEIAAYGLLRALEAVSLKERSLVILLNREGCSLINLMNRRGMLQVFQENGRGMRYPILSGGRNAQRLDYGITLPNGKTVKLIAVPTFALRMAGNRLAFLERYYRKAFTEEEKKLLAAGIGIV